MVENRNMAVGLFMSAALILSIGFTIWITGKKGDQPTTYYSILFEKDVTGLMLGGPVFFMGVNIGQVDNMVIVPGNPTNIRVDIEVLASTPVHAGTWATLAAQGITGVSVINLASDPGEHSAIQAVPGFDYPLIPQRDTGFSAILSSAPALLQKMETLLDRASAMLDETNYALIQNTLSNIETISETIASQEEHLKALPGELRTTLDQVQGILGQLDATLSEAEPGIQASVNNIQAATGRLASITERLEGWLVSNDSEMNEFMADGLGQVPALIEDARGTLREMEKLLSDLRADPDRLIYKTEQDALQAEE